MALCKLIFLLPYILSGFLSLWNCRNSDDAMFEERDGFLTVLKFSFSCTLHNTNWTVLEFDTGVCWRNYPIHVHVCIRSWYIVFIIGLTHCRVPFTLQCQARCLRRWMRGRTRQATKFGFTRHPPPKPGVGEEAGEDLSCCWPNQALQLELHSFLPPRDGDRHVGVKGNTSFLLKVSRISTEWRCLVCEWECLGLEVWVLPAIRVIHGTREE